MSDYIKMRQNSTTEPMTFDVPAELKGTYCVQEHNAKRAGWHEDFRFEHDGVAISWAIPKGLPGPGDKRRLAIRTEDHPVPYMIWEGTIPDGSYGAGDVRLVDRGRREIIHMDDDHVKVKLTGGLRAGTYSLYRTDGNKWIVTRKQ